LFQRQKPPKPAEFLHLFNPEACFSESTAVKSSQQQFNRSNFTAVQNPERKPVTEDFDVNSGKFTHKGKDSR